MKANEIMNVLFEMAQKRDYSASCDTCKSGDPEREVQKVAVAMFPTPNVVRAAKDWGAELLIVHEPTYYNHMDRHSDEKLEVEKRRFIEESGLTIYRYHDHPHYTDPDVIAAGQIRQFGFVGKTTYRGFDYVRVVLDTPMTPVEVAKQIEKNCGIRHLRIAGTRDVPCTNITGMFGTPGGVFEELRSDDCEILLTGEASEWSLCEYARDAAQLGHKKALIVMGHIGSERDGMVYTADILREKCPELDVKYFECGEVYTYTDDEI